MQRYKRQLFAKIQRNNRRFFAKIQRFQYSCCSCSSKICMRQIDYSNSGLCSKVCFVSYFFFTVVLMIIFFCMFHIGNETAFHR